MARLKHELGLHPRDTLTKSITSNSNARNGLKPSTNKKDLSAGTRYDSARYKVKKEHANFELFSIADEDEDNNRTGKSTSTERMIDITEPEENKDLPTKEKRIEGAGIISSMNLSSNNIITIPYYTEGITKIVNSDSTHGEICRLVAGLKITLTKGPDFLQKKPNLSIQFMRKDNKPIEGFCFGINDGIVLFIYDAKGEGFGVIFSSSKSFSVAVPGEKDARSVRTHCISWTCTSHMAPESNKFLELIKTYKKLLPKSNLVPDNILKGDKGKIDEMINEYKKPTSRHSPSTFSKLDKIQKKDLKSLQKTRKGGCGSKIPPPEPTYDLEEKVSRSEAIPQKSFYAEPKKPFSYVSSLSRKTRSATNSNTKENYQSFSDDLIEQEQPEEFKPTLSYTFSDGFKISVNNQDFKCLYNHDWINDTILDFFLKYYIEESINSGIVSRTDVYLFSSFFYTKLISTSENRYENVKKWVNNSNLFSKTFVVLPVNMNYHWFGCIITNLNKIKDAMEKCKESHQHVITGPGNENSTIPSNPSAEQNISEKYYTCTENDLPTISLLVFDSLRQTHSKLMDAVKDFIIDYGKDVHQFSIPRNKIKVKTCLVPEQPNMSDCGVHVILNIKKFFEKPKETLDLWYTRSPPNYSKKVNEFFEKKERLMARKSLRALLQDLQKQQITANGEANCDTKDESIEENHSDLEIIENFEESLMNDKIQATSDSTNNETQRDPTVTIQRTHNLSDSITSSIEMQQKRPTSEAEQSIYFNRNSHNTALTNSIDGNMSEDVTTNIRNESKNNFSSLDNHNKMISNEGQPPICASQLSDRDYMEKSDFADDFLSSQPPDTQQRRNRRATQELDNVDDDSSIDEGVLRKDSSPELDVNEKLSPLPDRVLNERFQRLRTTEHANGTRPSKEEKITNSIYTSAEISPNTNKQYHQSNDSFFNQGSHYNGKESPEVLNEKISLELEEEIKVSPDWNHKSTNNKIPEDFSSPNSTSSPTDSVEEILNKEAIKESEEQPKRRTNKRSFEHIYENGKAIYASNNPKIPKPNNVFNKSASK